MEIQENALLIKEEDGLLVLIIFCQDKRRKKSRVFSVERPQTQKGENSEM